MIEKSLPSDQLKKYVYSYQNIDFEFPVAMDNFFVANTSYWLVLVCGDPMDIQKVNFNSSFELPVASDQKFSTTESYIVCSSFHPVKCTAFGKVCFFDVELTPLGLSLFMGKSFSNWANKIIKLSELIGKKESDEFTNAIKAASTLESRKQLFETYITSLAKKNSPTEQIVFELCEKIKEKHGVVSLEELANHCQWSQTYTRKKFKEVVGYSPKLYSRIVRFNKLLSDLHHQPSDWSTLFTTHNYYDQSHLIKEFHEFSGFSPEEYMKKNFSICIDQIIDAKTR